MTDNITWHSFNDLAAALQEKHPDEDLLSLTDERLAEMLTGLDLAAHLPPLPENRRDILFAVKIAWSRQMEGDEAYNAHEDDAYV
ncbi:MAG: Fe-S cluster assembly protein IscX [Alphaproteobacteria bacterium]|jgi:hypothetical protein